MSEAIYLTSKVIPKSPATANIKEGDHIYIYRYLKIFPLIPIYSHHGYVTGVQNRTITVMHLVTDGFFEETYTSYSDLMERFDKPGCDDIFQSDHIIRVRRYTEKEELSVADSNFLAQELRGGLSPAWGYDWECETLVTYIKTGKKHSAIWTFRRLIILLIVISIIYYFYKK